MRTVLLASLVMLAVILSGCQEQWGQGDPPTEWQNQFGNDNLSRLNFAQTKVIAQQGGVLYGTKDPNNLGVIKFIVALDSRIVALEAQITQFEALNAQQHKKLGETDIRFYERMEEMESDASPDIVICDKCGRASVTTENELCICPRAIGKAVPIDELCFKADPNE